MIIIDTQEKKFSEVIPIYRDFDYVGSIYVRSDEKNKYIPAYISFKPQPRYTRRRLYVKKSRKKLRSLIFACYDNNINFFFVDMPEEKPRRCSGIKGYWMKLNENLEYVQNEPR